MNKKIIVIELLNKIVNGEEVPKRIKLYSNIYTLKSVHETPTYYNDNDKTLWEGYNFSILNDEVEILEDNTEEIEELDRNLKFDDLITPYGKNEDMMWTEIIKQHNKINELVKAVKEIRKDLNK